MAVDIEHDAEALAGEVVGNIAMEEVRHRVDEDPTGLAPSHGNPQPFGPQANCERIGSVGRRVNHRKA